VIENLYLMVNSTVCLPKTKLCFKVRLLSQMALLRWFCLFDQWCINYSMGHGLIIISCCAKKKF